MNKSATSQQYVYFSPPRRGGRGKKIFHSVFSASLRCIYFSLPGRRGRGKRFFTLRSQRRCSAFIFHRRGTEGAEKDFSLCVLGGSAVRFTTAQYTSNLFRKCARTLAVSCQFCYGTITTAPPEGSSTLHLPFQASGRPNAPFSPCGRRGQGG